MCIRDRSYTETSDDLFLAFDIFSYLTFCQNEAMEVQRFFESLLSTGSTQTILQATMNNLKMTYKYKSTKMTLLHLYKELSLMMDLKLSEILVAMYGSAVIDRASNGAMTNGSQNHNNKMSLQDHTSIHMIARTSKHPVSIYDEQG